MWNSRPMTQVYPNKHADCPQLHRIVRQGYPENGINIIHCIAWATNRYNRLWFVGTNHATLIWMAPPVIPPSLNDLNLPTNPNNILAAIAVANPTEEIHDENYSPQSPEPSKPSQRSTPPMKLSTIEGWETPHTTTDDNTFYSDEPRRICFRPSRPSPTPPPRKLKRKLSLGMSFPEKGSVASRLRG